MRLLSTLHLRIQLVDLSCSLMQSALANPTAMCYVCYVLVAHVAPQQGKM
jgi:hypothetical protein